MKNRHFSKSLIYALQGIRDAFSRERNLRFHVAAANVVFVFAWFFGLTRTEWAVLILTVSAVISAELFNTAVENAVDFTSSQIQPTAKLAKDAAAGAVLCAAIAAVLVGLCLFLDIVRIAETIQKMTTQLSGLIACCYLVVATVLILRKRKG